MMGISNDMQQGDSPIDTWKLYDEVVILISKQDFSQVLFLEGWVESFSCQNFRADPIHIYRSFSCKFPDIVFFNSAARHVDQPVESMVGSQRLFGSSHLVVG